MSDEPRGVNELRALRRVATLAAEGVDPHQLFVVVAEEIARVVDVPTATVFRYESDGTVSRCARSDTGPEFALGTRFAVDGPSVLGRIRTTWKPARVDDYSTRHGELADAVRFGGISSAVGAPIVVSGRLWGAVIVSSPHPEPLPEDTEARLADFTELLATAIANAESRAALERLADEQAALQRVATLVAQGVPPAEIFSAVSNEVDGLFDCGAGVARFEDDPPATVFAGVSKRITVPIGTRFEFQDGMASAEVYRTHQPARVDRNDWSTGDGALETTARSVGLVSAVASPIVVDGRLWGTMNLWSTDGLLPRDTGERLEKFTELIAAAIANTESREALRLLADEQAALRRVATLVAKGVPPEELFAAVSDEVGRVFGTDTASVVRLEREPLSIVVVGKGKGIAGVPLGTRLPLDDGLASSKVYRTGRSGRVEQRDFVGLTGTMRAAVRRMRHVSAVASPITVGDALWGTLTLSAPEPLPPGTEKRLERFGELVGIAIASADAQDSVRVLADEQAALRRVATLVARGVPSDELFSAVSNEVGQLFGSDTAAVVRFEHEPPSIVVVGTGKGMVGIPLGTRLPLDEGLGSTEVYRTGRSARVDERQWGSLSEILREAVRRQGVVSAVASPIRVGDALWGTINLSATEPMPPGTEIRLERFGELVGIAIASADAQEALRLLADEQAALRHVATLVAQGVPAAEMFSAVSQVVARLFGDDLAGVARFEVDGSAVTLVGFSRELEGAEIGARLPIDDETPAGRVLATGRSARFDRAAEPTGTPPFAQRFDIVSSVSSPITVEGRLWGVMSALSTTQPLPLDTERRLGRFSELIATAIANAEAQESVRLLADEQAALRRVATLVAQGVPAADIFSAVTEEVARLFGEDLAAVGKFHVGGTLSLVGLSRPVEGIEMGMLIQIDDETPAGRVYSTGHPARVDRPNWSAPTSEMGEFARRLAIVSSVSSPIMVEGTLWGAMSALSTTKPLPPDTERRLERFSELVATAIANTESRTELAASRRRIVAASDDARRRIERNLHDGTQQRLVSLALSVRAIESDVPPSLHHLRSELSQVATGLTDAVTELQEIARGIHPATLAQNGLGAALRTLARRSAIPVNLDMANDRRLPEPVEVAAYYVASEALANAAKHSQATLIEISVARRDDGVHLAIRDNGVGGADPALGSGLVGLIDRIEALGGTLEVRSPSGHGTSMTAMLPLGAELGPALD